MRAMLVLVLAIVACGDNSDAPPADAALTLEGGIDAGGGLFGEACTQPPFPEIGVCHEGEGGCNDEAGSSVCRPFCHINGEPQCIARGGTEQITDRGACVCIPQ